MTTATAQQVLDLFDTGRVEEAQPEVRAFHTHGRVRHVTYTPPAAGQRHRACDDRCIHAVSDICSCRCGGANHGVGIAAYLTDDQIAELLRDYQ